jgi:hypothetical protein
MKPLRDCTFKPLGNPWIDPLGGGPGGGPGVPD